MRGRRGEPALMLGEGVGVERVLPRQILGVDERVRAGDALAERRRRLLPLAVAVIGMAGRGQIGLRQIRPLATSRPSAMRRPRPTP